jgi:soluble lytic murein transglycosylase-like protein
MKFGFALLCIASANAQAPANFEQSVQTAMARSLAQQRASISMQVATTAKTGSARQAQTFFSEQPPLSLGLLADCEPVPADRLNGLITAASQKHGVSFDLIKAVIEEESAARPCAVSFRGAQGLMQLMPATAEEFDVQDPFDPEQNVAAGAKLLKQLLAKYDNNLSLALSAYNAGPGRVDEEGGIPPIPETLNYVADILKKLQPEQDKPEEFALPVAASQPKEP